MHLEQAVFERAITVFPEPHRHYLRNIWFFVAEGPSVYCRWKHFWEPQSNKTSDIIFLSRRSLYRGPRFYLRDFFHELGHALLMHLDRPELKDRNLRRKLEWQASNLGIEWRKAAGEAVAKIFEEFIPKLVVSVSEEKAPEETSEAA